ncbi:MAG: DUF488 domain-containing protein [Armatimonadetes bacterium]|nr:DUF488 domain-containing protein [Armatimonadota bacterium]
MGLIKLNRIYEPANPSDGTRVLVERLWPRGISKQRAALDLWLKDIAPSPQLRSWFGHDPEKWDEFRRRYRQELDNNAGAVAQLRDVINRGDVTFVYAAHDTIHNAAVALKEYMEETDADKL